jgi:hypothetical protein
VTPRSNVLARLLAVGATAAALAAPPASARPIDGPNEPYRADPNATAVVAPEPAPADAPIVRSVDAGFDWGSAAIGAGGAGGLFALVLLGGSVISARHHIRVSQ